MVEEMTPERIPQITLVSKVSSGRQEGGCVSSGTSPKAPKAKRTSATAFNGTHASAEKPTTLTLGSLDQQPLEALVCADLNGPVGGLAQHCRGDPVKVRGHYQGNPNMAQVSAPGDQTETQKRVILFHQTSQSMSQTDPEYRARGPSSLPILIIAWSMPLYRISRYLLSPTWPWTWSRVLAKSMGNVPGRETRRLLCSFADGRSR